MNARRILTSLAIASLLGVQSSAALALSPSQDTDGDGIPDVMEDANGNNVLDAGETNPYKADSDGGGESDGAEIAAKRNPLDPTDDLTADTDGDGWVNGIELLHNTDPKMPDTDGDGINDPQDAFPLDSKYHTDSNANNLPDEWEQKTGLDQQQVTPSTTDDTDGDGLSNAQEFARGTSPVKADSDRDGVDDKTEIDEGTDPKESACLFFAAASDPFTDMTGHWSSAYVTTLARTQILPDSRPLIGGYSLNGKKLFAPDQPVTRYEFLKMTMLSTCTKLWNTADDLKPVFSDVRSTSVINENDDAAQKRRVIYTAVHFGVVGGYDDGTFRPDAPVNRAEALKILTLASQLGTFASSGSLLTPPAFSDVTDNDWFAPYVREMAIRGIVSGYGDGSFGPEKPITHAEAAKIIHEVILQNPLINGYVLSE